MASGVPGHATDVIAAYMPRIAQQPDFRIPMRPSATSSSRTGESCGLARTPGTFWVGEGTIVDGDTQAKLINFLTVAAIVVTGQDVAWALTRDGVVKELPLLTA